MNDFVPKINSLPTSRRRESFVDLVESHLLALDVVGRHGGVHHVGHVNALLVQSQSSSSSSTRQFVSFVARGKTRGVIIL